VVFLVLNLSPPLLKRVPHMFLFDPSGPGVPILVLFWCRTLPCSLNLLTLIRRFPAQATPPMVALGPPFEGTYLFVSLQPPCIGTPGRARTVFRLLPRLPSPRSEFSSPFSTFSAGSTLSRDLQKSKQLLHVGISGTIKDHVLYTRSANYAQGDGY